MAMNAEWKEKWLEALRSGDYSQCKGVMRKEPTDSTAQGPSFCCLGVLRDLIDPDARTGVGHEYLAAPHADLVGITVKDQFRLSELNDDGCTFPQIAKVIERLL
jgi:hypothetical protein